MRRPAILSLAYGLLVRAPLGWAEHRGWSLLATDEREEPLSVRDNPGADRPLYVTGRGRHRGGK
jgi:hypothetical protein